MDATHRANSLNRVAPSVAADGDVVCRIASNRKSLQAAFRLIYSAYLRERLAQPNRLRLRIVPHQLLETSTVWVAVRNRRVIGTLTVVTDGAMGLPIERLYANELARLRQSGRRVAELTCLATKRLEHSVRWAALRGLLQAALRQTRAVHMDQLVICIHPRQQNFYQERLGFFQLGPQRRCPWVSGQAAVAMHHVLSKPWEEVPRASLARTVKGGQRELERRRALRAAREEFWSLLAEASPLPWPATCPRAA